MGFEAIRMVLGSSALQYLSVRQLKLLEKHKQYMPATFKMPIESRALPSNASVILGIGILDQ